MDEDTTKTTESQESTGAQFAQAMKEAMGPIYEQNRQLLEAMQQQQQQPAARPVAQVRQRSASDLGLDSDDPYSGQFTSVVRELAGLKAENQQLRDQVQNLGVTTMQSQLGSQVEAALKSQNIPASLHDTAKAVIYSVISSGQPTTPEAVALNFMEGIRANNETVRQDIAAQAAKPKPPMFRGQEFGPEMKEPSSMEEAHEMFAEIADSLMQGAALEPLSEAEGN
mgnify:CR=1 FL=1